MIALFYNTCHLRKVLTTNIPQQYNLQYAARSLWTKDTARSYSVKNRARILFLAVIDLLTSGLTRASKR